MDLTYRVTTRGNHTTQRTYCSHRAFRSYPVGVCYAPFLFHNYCSPLLHDYHMRLHCILLAPYMQDMWHERPLF